MLQVHLIDFLFSTTDGLYRYKNGGLTRLFSGDYYGITRYSEGVWVAANRSELSLDLFDLEGRLLERKSGLIERHTHQIDMIDGRLFLVNTDTNTIRILAELEAEKDLFPSGKAVRGEKNFRHFNSIFGFDGRLYVIAHNLGEYTGKTSELFIIEGDEVERIDLESFSCHNFVLKDSKIYICRSKASSISENNETLHKKEGFFTRGLSIGVDSTVYGYNNVSPDFKKRSGRIAVVSKEFCYDIEVGAPVNEVRQISFDYGLSQDACKQYNFSESTDAMSPELVRSILRPEQRNR